MKRLLTSLRHAWKAIWEHPFRYLPIFTELCLAIIIFGMVGSNLHKSVQYTSAMKRCADHTNLYLVKDRSDVPYIMSILSDPVSEEKCKELFSFITGCSNAYIHLNTTVRSEKGDVTILQLNREFWELYPFYIKKGRAFYENEWELTGETGMIIPVVVGSNMESTYPVGTEFSDYAGQSKARFRVIGVFSEQAFYLNPTITYDRLPLDDSIVAPWFPFNGLNNGYRNVNLFHIIQVEAKDKETLMEIANKSRLLGLFDLEFVSYKEQITDVTAYYQNVNQIWITILFVVLLYSVISCITVLVDYIHHHLKDFAIFYLCGASKKDMETELLLQIAFPILLGVIISVIIHQSLQVLLGTMVFGLLVVLLMWIVPDTILKKKTISDLLRRNE